MIDVANGADVFYMRLVPLGLVAHGNYLQFLGSRFVETNTPPWDGAASIFSGLESLREVVPGDGFAPSSSDSKSEILLLDDPGIRKRSARQVLHPQPSGYEPAALLIELQTEKKWHRWRDLHPLCQVESLVSYYINDSDV